MDIQLVDVINVVAILAVGYWLHRGLHREISTLRERMSRIEGSMNTLMQFMVKRRPKSATVSPINPDGIA